MKDAFSSKALEANLAQTRYEKIEIPDEHQWFLDLSKSYYGIHKRTEEFIQECNHTYINYDYVIEGLHNVSLVDLWFYVSLEESLKALLIIVDIYKRLLEADLKEKSREQLIATLVKFIDLLSRQDDPQMEVIGKCIDILERDIHKNEVLYIYSSNYFKVYFSRIAEFPEFSDRVFNMTRTLLYSCVDYWESTSKAEDWFEEKKELFSLKQRETIPSVVKTFFSDIREKLHSANDWHDLDNMMFFNDIADYFRNMTGQFDSSLEKIYYIFYLMHLPGMSFLKDHLLYDLNKLLKDVLDELDSIKIVSFIDNIIGLFEELKSDHMSTVLDCILTLGKKIISSKDQKIINYYIKKLIGFGFVHPGNITISSDWQTRVDPNHIKNLRVWLELIECSPSMMRELLSALIVNLKLGGIFISDTDLFQKDITKLLNSQIALVYKQMKQLARIFPVYFREIGAEGKLREVTTSLDELSHRKDRLIHFLRKQIHTESNNTHIELTKKIMRFWYDGDITKLEQVLPRDVFESIDLNGEWFINVHQIVSELCAKKDMDPAQLLEINEAEFESELNSILNQNERDKKRIMYLYQLYKLILEKYSLESGSILSCLKGSRFLSGSETEELSQSLCQKDTRLALSQIFKLMDRLKSIILDPKKSEGLENIYYKRHIAFGIPSMYGQYTETKFEALGLMFRLERAASRLMGEMVGSVNLEYITAKTMRFIYQILKLFKEGLEIDGIESQGFDSNLEMFKYGLTSPNFSFDQYVNIFQFMAQNVKEIINEYFLRVYDQSLKVIIPEVFDLKKICTDSEMMQTYHKKAEVFYREILSSAFLIQQLDNFISNIVTSLESMADNYSGLFIKNMMTYDPDLIVSPLQTKTREMDNPVFLGAKAYYLKKLINYGMPVPPGFVLTTQFYCHKDTVIKHPYMSQEFDQILQRQISDMECMTGMKFGDPSRPLLFSVRSGAAISMPGAMSTFLNVGMNDEIVEALSRRQGFEWASWDCYRRFIQSWGMACGINRDIFDNVMIYFKNRFGVEQKAQFTPEQMKNIACSYNEILEDYKIHIEDEPFMQLKQAIINVIDSWSSRRARSYREHLQIADEWGTAVVVQKMVLGNISNSSGSGVVFTHNPKQNMPGVDLYGDFTLRSQGEDIVSGLVHTLPVTETQRHELNNGGMISLELSFPNIYKRLIELSTQLIEAYGFNHQEIEFTFESDRPEDLYILQVREQKITKQEKLPVFENVPEGMKPVGRGIGIGGGAISGILSFDMEDLITYKNKYKDEKHIIVRPDTVPDDIPMIFICDGLITGKGGATSHAAVTAVNLGKVCIVNCKDLYVNEFKKECTIGGVTFKSGDRISIEGQLGNIYMGSYHVIS